MNLFQVYDIRNGLILADLPIIEAKNTKDALVRYFKDRNETIKVKRSGDYHVHFGVQEVTRENGKILILGWKRKVWYKIQ